MDKRDYLIVLFDYYSELFNDKEREYFIDYYFNNLSLSEIASNYNVSRNAIYKVLKFVVSRLEFYEEKLCLYEKKKKLIKLIDSLEDVKLKIKIADLF